MLQLLPTLVSRGADVNFVDPVSGVAPLHVAATAGDAACVRALLAVGADVALRDDGEYTPLHLAACNPQLECVAALLDAGAAVDPTDLDGCTPLFYAAKKGHLGCVALLLRSGADPAHRNELGRTPLDDAANAEARSAIAAALAGRTHSFRQLCAPLPLCEPLLAGLAELGLETPSHVQALTLLLMLARPRRHLFAKAPNGSGKTVAMLLAMLALCDPALQQPTALCVCPTRELVVQSVEVLRTLAAHTRITCMHSALQTSKASQFEMPPISDQIVIATPGTLINWLRRKHLPIKCVSPASVGRSVGLRVVCRVMYTTTQQVLTTVMNDFVQNTIFRMTAPPHARATALGRSAATHLFACVMALTWHFCFAGASRWLSLTRRMRCGMRTASPRTAWIS